MLRPGALSSEPLLLVEVNYEEGEVPSERHAAHSQSLTQALDRTCGYVHDLFVADPVRELMLESPARPKHGSRTLSQHTQEVFAMLVSQVRLGASSGQERCRIAPRVSKKQFIGQHTLVRSTLHKSTVHSSSLYFSFLFLLFTFPLTLIDPRADRVHHGRPRQVEELRRLAPRVGVRAAHELLPDEGDVARRLGHGSDRLGCR